MAISTVLPILNLSLFDMRNQSSLAIVDLSSYLTLPTSDQLALQITPPGWPTINVPFTPGTVNVYKCVDLGIECDASECCPLPDGIYDVVYTIASGSPIIPNVPPTTQTTSLEKTFIKIDQLRCKFQNAFLKVDLACDCASDEQRQYKQELRRIDLIMNGAVAEANSCNDLMAFNLYQKANQMIDNISCKFGLPCTSVPSCDKCN